MRTGVLIGAVLALAATSATDATACGRRSVGCSDYGPPPVAYQYAPVPPGYGYAPVPYGYAPPAPVYSWAPPRNIPAYGYGGLPNCGRAYGYAPPAAYEEDYTPAAVWVPVR